MTFDLRTLFWLWAMAWVASGTARGDGPPVRSTATGRWSEPTTWEGGRVPAAGDRVEVRAGHSVAFDARVEAPIRSIQIAGTLDFDPDRDTLLTVGLIEVGTTGMAHDPHGPMAGEGADRPSLLVGTQARPIPAGRTAMIRLAMVEGLDPEDCPAIVCQGGRMEFHGASLGATWVKLAEPALAGATSVKLVRSVEGWKSGDRLIVTATRRQFHRNETLTPTVRQDPRTEERTIRSIDGDVLTLDAPLVHPHLAAGDRRGEVALLSRNVVIESADPGGVRGHTMYHRGSMGSISFAEFRHLGKPGKLGKYSLHFHKAGDTMRGASVIGASIWDSGNRWITIHGTNRLVVRDCVGYGSLGHGFFLEDGTEVENILDGNLAVQALATPPLPGQVITHDRNEGAGFWWANNRNAFVRNVAVESDGYGFRLEGPGPEDGPPGPVGLGSEPFIRFDMNEAHAQRHYGVNLGGTPDEVPSNHAEPASSDSKHPLTIRGLRIWDSHWAFTPAVPGTLVDKLSMALCDYGFYQANFDRQSYRGLTVYQIGKRFGQAKGTFPDEATFPEPVDDRPPVGVIVRVDRIGAARFRVEGAAADDGPIKSVRVNGVEARPLVADFSRWEATVGPIEGRRLTLTAITEDLAGNVDPRPHVLQITTAPVEPKHSSEGSRPAH